MVQIFSKNGQNMESICIRDRAVFSGDFLGRCCEKLGCSTEELRAYRDNGYRYLFFPLEKGGYKLEAC